MARKGNTARKQEKFLQALLLGKSIVDAAKDAGIAERTAHRWLGDPAFQAERKAREEALAKEEQAEIERILTTGYAAVHERVKALGDMARLIEQSYREDGKEDGNVIYQWLAPDKVREWRGCLDDIARELGQRIKKQEVTGKDGAPVSSFHTVFVLPQLDDEEQSADANDSPPAIE